jgi:hypothetical protein
MEQKLASEQKLAAPPMALRMIVFADYGEHDQLFCTEYSRDQNAIIELVDQFNGRKTWDIRAAWDQVGEYVVLVKHGHVLGVIPRSQLIDAAIGVTGSGKPAIDRDKVHRILEEVNHRRGKRLKAAPEVAAASDGALQSAGHQANN